MQTTNDKLKALYEDIVNGTLSLEVIKEMFNGYQCYMSKNEFGALVTDLIGEVDFTIIKEILKSRKGKLYDDYKDEYGEPIVNILILTVAFLKENFDKYKEGLFELLEDEEVELKWGQVNNNIESTLHIVCFLSNVFNKDDLIRFINILKKHNYNPLNRDDMHRNSIEVFKYRNTYSSEDEKEVVDILEEMANNFVIEVNNYVDEEVEVTVNSEG
jgi:hypothetical protein